MDSDDQAGFDFLLEKRSEEEIRQGFDTQCARALAKKLGLSAAYVREEEELLGAPLSLEWFLDTYPEMPLRMCSRRIPSFSVQQMFESPTKSPVFSTFREMQSELDEGDRFFAMFFRAKGFTTLVMSDCPKLNVMVRTCLRFRVRDLHYYLTTMEGLADVCKQLWPLSSEG